MDAFWSGSSKAGFAGIDLAIREFVTGRSFPFTMSEGRTTGVGPRPSSVAILDFRSRRLADPTIGRPDHEAGIVMSAGGEIGFEVGQMPPLQFKLCLEGEGFANTWLIRG